VLISSRDTADKLLDDSAWRQEMKAEILRRAQEVSDGEEETRYGPVSGPSGRRQLVIFDEDEFDDDFGNVSVVGDGETSDGEDEEVEEKVCRAVGHIPDISDHVYQVPVETRLELLYIETPALFGRDPATRKSAARKGLRDEIGACLPLYAVLYF
jgi:activating signal cointegrator complex subunit 2